MNASDLNALPLVSEVPYRGNYIIPIQPLEDQDEATQAGPFARCGEMTFTDGRKFALLVHDDRRVFCAELK